MVQHGQLAWGCERGELSSQLLGGEHKYSLLSVLLTSESISPAHGTLHTTQLSFLKIHCDQLPPWAPQRWTPIMEKRPMRPLQATRMRRLIPLPAEMDKKTSKLAKMG
jgi:hypothetical protein